MSYYQESGKVNLPFTVIMMIIGAAVIGLLAYGYAFLTNINPFIYFNFLATLGYALIVGVIANMVKRAGKMRSFSTSIIMSIILGAFGLFAVWLSFIAIVFDETFSFALTNFVDAIDILSHQSFSIGRAMRSSSLEFSGGMLYFMWAIEALVLFVGPIFLVFAAGKNDSVYCEDCDKWANNEKIYLKKSLTLLSKENIEMQVTGNNVNQLLEMDDAKEMDPSYYEIIFTSCGNCKQSYFLSVNHVTNQNNSKGENEKNETIIFPFYELDNHIVPREIINASAIEGV